MNSRRRSRTQSKNVTLNLNWAHKVSEEVWKREKKRKKWVREESSKNISKSLHGQIGRGVCIYICVCLRYVWGPFFCVACNAFYFI